MGKASLSGVLRPRLGLKQDGQPILTVKYGLFLPLKDWKYRARLEHIRPSHLQKKRQEGIFKQALPASWLAAKAASGSDFSIA
jgi:hypothetical protein